MFQNVADEEISAADSASFIIAQMTAFGIEAENAQHIIDAVNETSNQFSVSSADLANSLGNMSAAMAAGNVTFEEGLGLLVAGTEVTRNSNKVSRALVSVQSRLNQILDEGSSTGKALTAWYEEHNIAIYDQEGQLRSLYDILTDVAEIWPTLTRNEQAYYLNQQAGGCAHIKVNCGNLLRALFTKLLWKHNNGIINHYGIVKAIRIGKSAAKIPYRNKVQRLSHWSSLKLTTGVRPKS